MKAYYMLHRSAVSSFQCNGLLLFSVNEFLLLYRTRALKRDATYMDRKWNSNENENISIGGQMWKKCTHTHTSKIKNIYLHTYGYSFYVNPSHRNNIVCCVDGENNCAMENLFQDSKSMWIQNTRMSLLCSGMCLIRLCTQVSIQHFLCLFRAISTIIFSCP